MLTRLRNADAELVLVLAPAGYGKTTLVSQWAAERSGRVAWATVTESDRDPAVLISTLLSAIEAGGSRLEPLRETLTGDEPDFSRRVLPRFQRAVEQVDRPLTLVVDDVHAMPGVQAAVVLTALLDSLPEGSRLALVGRARPDLPVALWRSQGRLVELGQLDLAFDVDEARGLVDALPEVSALTDQQVQQIVRSTEGWPVAVYLQALAVARGQSTATSTATALNDYLDTIVLGGAEDPLVTFLRRTSVLSTLSATSCNTILDITDSRRRLREAEHATLLVTRLDGDGGYYRLHPVLRHRLSQELWESARKEAQILNARAARWCDDNGFVEEAIGHAQLSGDSALLGRLVWHYGATAVVHGRPTAVRGWLARATDEQVAATPTLGITAAWLAVLNAEGATALRWADATSQALGPQGREDLSRSTVHAALGLLMAFPGTPSYEAAAALSGDSYNALPAVHPMRPLALFVHGAYLVLSGDTANGRASLEHARDLARAADLATTWAGTSAFLALVEVQAESWAQAEVEISEARTVWRTHHLFDGIGTAWIFAVSGFLHASAGARTQAEQDLHRVEEVVSGLTVVLPALRVLMLSFVARANAALDHHTAAAAAARSARDALDRSPDSSFLSAAVAAADQAVERSGLLARLTPAEHRLWPYLLHRSTVREIAAELHVSPETVKTQLGSIYRKLDVSSRRELQDLADRLGSSPS